VGRIDPLIKTESEPLLVSPNPNPNKPWILAENKVLIKPKQAYDANLVITWSRNPHAKTSIPGKPSKSGLIGV